MGKSPIDLIPMTIKHGECPDCGKWIKVDDRKFITHKQRPPIREICPNSGKSIPDNWR